MITTQSLLPVCRQIWDEIRLSPGFDAHRWQVNRVVQPHGTRRSVLLWRVWDARCNSHGLDPRYFCWCFNYDPEHYYNRETHWQLHLYINTIRLYRHADTLRSTLPPALKQACPPGFHFLNDDHSVQLVWNFDHPGPLTTLPEKAAPMLKLALLATAPVFDDIFALLARPAPREVPAVRPSAARVSNPSVASAGGTLSRSVPPALRRRVIARSTSCALCGVAFQADDDIHVDHIHPWAQGGLTVLENLQAAHAACNLAKGSRPL